MLPAPLKSPTQSQSNPQCNLNLNPSFLNHLLSLRWRLMRGISLDGKRPRWIAKAVTRRAIHSKANNPRSSIEDLGTYWLASLQPWVRAWVLLCGPHGASCGACVHIPWRRPYTHRTVRLYSSFDRSSLGASIPCTCGIGALAPPKRSIPKDT